MWSEVLDAHQISDIPELAQAQSGQTGSYVWQPRVSFFLFPGGIVVADVYRVLSLEVRFKIRQFAIFKWFTFS